MNHLLQKNPILTYEDISRQLGSKESWISMRKFCKESPHRCLVKFYAKKVHENQIVCGYASYQQLYELLSSHQCMIQSFKPLAIVEDPSYFRECLQNVKKQMPKISKQVQCRDSVENRRIKYQKGLSHENEQQKGARINNKLHVKQSTPKNTKHPPNAEIQSGLKTKLPRVKSSHQGQTTVYGVKLNVKYSTSDQEDIEEEKSCQKGISHLSLKPSQKAIVQSEVLQDNHEHKNIQISEEQADFQLFLEKKKQKQLKLQQAKPQNKNINLPPSLGSSKPMINKAQKLGANATKLSQQPKNDQKTLFAFMHRK